MGDPRSRRAHGLLRRTARGFCAQPFALLHWTGAHWHLAHGWPGHPDHHGMAQGEPGSLPCYTFGSMYRDNEDVSLARRVAKICGQPHQVITVGEEFLSRFPHYAERSIYMTDACVDLGRSPDLYVNEKAREIAPVRIVGTYGSEMLLHAVMFKAEYPAAGLYDGELGPQIQAAKETYDASQKVHPVTFVAFRQSPWHHYGVLALEQTQVAVRSPYLDNDLVKTVYKAPASVSLAINQEARSKL